MLLSSIVFKYSPHLHEIPAIPQKLRPMDQRLPAICLKPESLLQQRKHLSWFHAAGGRNANIHQKLQDSLPRHDFHRLCHILLDFDLTPFLRRHAQVNSLCRTVEPPYGLLRPGTEDLAGVPLVKWSVDPRDWESRNREKIVSAVLEAVEPGSIVLLHDIYPASVDAALDIADRLQAQGYELVTVEELLSLYGREAAAGQYIRSASA